MNSIEKEDSFKDMISLFKEGYSSPTKALIWAKVVKEWAGVFIGWFIFGAVVLILILVIIAESRKKSVIVKPASEITVRSMEPGSSDQQTLAEQKIAPHIKDILTFMTVFAKSLNKRQEIFESLLKTTSHAYGEDQKALEQKVTAFATISRRCLAERGKFVSQMAKDPNPFEADISSAVRELLHNTQESFWEHSEKGVPLDPSFEVAQWDRLCTLCAQEVDKANTALLQVVEKTAKP